MKKEAAVDEDAEGAGEGRAPVLTTGARCPGWMELPSW